MENPFKAHLGKKESNCGKEEREERGGREGKQCTWPWEKRYIVMTADVT